MRTFIDVVLADALDQVRAAGVSVYTFAVYFDHESHALSVCVDTLENSRSTVASINEYNSKYFHKAVASGDLKGASLWQANIGRSLSLGDFHLVNVGRRDLPSNVKASPEFFVGLVQSLVSIESEVAALSSDPEALVFCCSGTGDEIEYCWSLGLDLPNQTIQRTPNGAAGR